MADQWLYPFAPPPQAQAAAETLQAPATAPVPFQAQVAPMPAPAAPEAPFPVPEGSLVCAMCGDFIEQDDDAIELILGRVGRGEKSGQPMVVPVPAAFDPPYVQLHVYCAGEFLRNFVYEEEEPMCCIGCEAKMMEG